MSSAAKKILKNPRAQHDFKGRTCSIAAVGSYVPERVLTNLDLERMVETTDNWITTRTGIKERRIAAKNEFTSDMAARAALRALERAGVTAQQIDLIIVATITPDMPFPATACLVQQKIGANRAAAFDIEAACSGFIYGLEIGQHFIMARTYDCVLVVGAEKLSSIIDWTDRNTCVLFGDGAGAAVLQNRPHSHGLLTACMGPTGTKPPCSPCRREEAAVQPAPNPWLPGCIICGWTERRPLRVPSTPCTRPLRNRCAAARSASKTLNASFLTKPTAGSLTRGGAVGSAGGAGVREPGKIRQHVCSIVAIALDEAVQSGRIQRGDLILLVVFGAGLTWGAAVIEW